LEIPIRLHDANTWDARALGIKADQQRQAVPRAQITLRAVSISSGGCSMSAARQALVSARTHFPLGQFDVAVIEVEGTVQLVYLAHGWGNGPMKTLANQFVSPETSSELRALADHLDTVDWTRLQGVA
jgi:hypothetical protein